MAAYDNDNIFAKILRGDIPSYKVFETEHTVAILDAFPVTSGHALLLPKKLGFNDISEMSPEESADLFAQLPKLCQMMKAATNAEAVNVFSNLGKSAGQMVFHPHIHVVPRKEGDGVFTLPESAKEMISKDTALALLEKCKQN